MLYHDDSIVFSFILILKGSFRKLKNVLSDGILYVVPLDGKIGQ